MATLAQLAEKARQDQYPHPPLTSTPRPPPLPPRESSTTLLPPPPYTSDDTQRSRLVNEQWHTSDPRSSSTHSLVPAESARYGRDGRRTLLLIYIHGFMGNETSFQIFPAHVHNILTVMLAESHVVHTKIYPRYKSRKAIEFARDDFSQWLEPHENENTDVILLGHSMGGLLSAEVVLQPPRSPATGRRFRHRILGTVNFDTPFLGMHPGVIVSGIGSLFRPAPDPPSSNYGAGSQATPSTYSTSLSPQMSRFGSEASLPLSAAPSITSPLQTPPADDPFYNPPFPNDVRIPERKGWTNILHFINKHSDGLTSATKQYFMSHLEFGGCLADYPGLKNRYDKIRSLEDVVEDNYSGPGYRPPKRKVRFVNYYTASTGRPKEPKASKIPEELKDDDGNLRPIEVEMQDMSLEPGGHPSPLHTPRISVEEYGDSHVTSKAVDETLPDPTMQEQLSHLGQDSGIQDDAQQPLTMRHIDSIPIQDDDLYDAPPELKEASANNSNATTETQPSSNAPPLPPIPPMPIEPDAVDLSLYTDKDDRKIAEKEQKRIMKAYQQAVKDRENAIKDRRKVIEKREKKERQEKEKQLKAEEKLRAKEEKEEEKRKATVNPEPKERRDSTAAAEKPKRDKKFCMLPPESGGRADKCWTRVYMEGVDEVGAHCGLFFLGPQYESLLSNLVERIETWVKEDASNIAHRQD